MVWSDTEWRAEKRLAMPPGVCSAYPCCIRPAADGAKRCERCRGHGRSSRKRRRERLALLPGQCFKDGCVGNAGDSKYCADHAAQANETVKQFFRKAKLGAFAAYGGACFCCGESTVEFLSIDHIDGYKEGPRAGQKLYMWLRRNNYPVGFRVLCMNCNTAKGLRGECPHIGLFRPTVTQSGMYQRAQMKRLREMTFNAYGGQKCACCGESQEGFLCVDHVNDDGASHRKQVGHGMKFYLWLKRNGFPTGFQILCVNCNFAKGHFGGCPHLPRKAA